MTKEDTGFHTKYRPTDLDQLIGHEKAVTILRGIASSGKIPGAISIFGPSSAGKTTLARAFAATVNGKPVEHQGGDYIELDVGSQRSIDDVRELIRLSKFRPQGKRKFIVLDECQAILSTPASATALLVSIESAAKTDTTWIICSMDPEKFRSNNNGKALLNRCNTQIVLEPHTNPELFKQGMRIVRGEAMSYVDKEVVKTVVKNSGGLMRNVANLLQNLQSYYEGMDKKPKALGPEDVSEILQVSESKDDKLVVPIVVGTLTGKFKLVQRNLIDVQDGFSMINKLLWASQFLVNNAVLEGERHPKVWWSPTNKELANLTKDVPFGHLAALSAAMIEVKSKSQAFGVGETELISFHLYKLVKLLYSKT